MNESDIIEIKGDIKVIQTQMDGVQSSIDKLSAGLGTRVQEHGERIAKIEVGLEGAENYIKSVSTDFKSDVDNRWKWISIVMSIIAFGAIVLKFIK